MNNLLPKDLFYIALSFFIVAFGQPSSFPICALLTQLGAYALFWYSLRRINEQKIHFLIALLWFAGIQLIQLSWMSAIEYQGFYIYVVYAGLALGIGLQFAILTIATLRIKQSAWLHAIIIASFWTLFEWSRLYFFTGFPWNPVGLASAANLYSAQMAAASGIYGLSFWLILTNVIALDAFKQKFALGSCLVWAMTAGLPFFAGYMHIAEYENSEIHHKANVLLVHTALTPDQKLPGRTNENPIVQSFLNWEGLLETLSPYQNEKIDLIVFPETTIALWAKYPLYPYESVLASFFKRFDGEHLENFPEAEEERVGNLFWLKAISKIFNADVVAGLDDIDDRGSDEAKSYNAAFHISPLNPEVRRYEKRILLPGAEYLPFSLLESIAGYYGIHGSFTPGTQVKIFQSKDGWKFGIAICNEEIYTYIGREARRLGAQCLISIHNDVWYPHSSLASQHFQHGRMRAIENGFPLLRSTNVGETVAVDAFGRVSSKKHEKLWEAGAVQAEINIMSFVTPYRVWGDNLIIIISLLGGVIGLVVLYKN